MNELQRLSYLDAMGVTTHVSRRQLDGAAPTRRLRILAPRAPAAPSKADTAAGANSLQHVRSGLDVPARAERVTPVQAELPPASADIPVFSLAVAYAGGRLWLEEIPRGRDPGAAYQQLLAGICCAMGWPDPAGGMDVFNWPLNNSAQLDHGERAARHGVSGFVQARLDHQQPEGVVILGPLDEAWFDRSLLDNHPVVELPSALQMLRRSELKREAWRILKALRDPGA